MTLPRRITFDRAALAFIAIAVALTWARTVALRLSPLDLYFDEAQYWLWSRSLEWGYFTKPPMVAWTIAATTSLFGDAEWAVRLASPIAHAVTAAAVYALGRGMYGAWAGFWAGFGWLVIPGVWMSSFIISTDAVLLPLWAIALLAVWRLVETRSMFWAVVLGAAVGFGTLAKYAMLYFPLCALLAARWSQPVREGLGGGYRWLVSAVLALAIVAPNIIWNAQHGFATAQHTAANARLDPTDLFNFDELVEFLGGQAGVVGPIVFMGILYLLWRTMRRAESLSAQDKFLLSFMLPPLLFVSVIAFISRANANWAVTAYPAGMIWLCGSLIATAPGRRWLAGGILLNTLIGGAMCAALFLADPSVTNQVKGVRISRNWQETAADVARRAQSHPGDAPFTAIMVDDRAAYFELSYYWRELRAEGVPLPPLRMWLLHGVARNSAEAIDPMRSEDGGRVLVLHMKPGYLPFVAGDFTVFRTVEPLQVPLGGGYTREFEISVGEGFAPAPRDAAFLERLNNESDERE